MRLPINQINKKVSAGNLISDISDHLPNYLIIDNEITQSKERPLIRLYNKTNIEKFNKNIANEPPLLPHPRSNDSNILLAEFSSNLNTILNKYFPLIRISRKQFKDKEYITNEIKIMIKDRNNLYDIFLKDRNDANKEKLRDKRNKTNQAIKNAEIKYYDTKIKEHGNNCNAMWKTLSHILNKNKKKNISINSLIIDQKQLSNQLDITKGLNNFFCHVAEKLASQLENTSNEYKTYFKQPANQSIYLYNVKEKELINQIKQLDSKKSSGHDGFTAKFLKLSTMIVAEPLTHIFNTSINTGHYPDELKIAKCIPIFKKGKKSDPSNYRPISILSTVNKLLEKFYIKDYTSILQSLIFSMMINLVFVKNIKRKLYLKLQIF